jgi:hypothetical protein
MSKTRNLSKVLALVIMLALVIGILPMGAMATVPEYNNIQIQFGDPDYDPTWPESLMSLVSVNGSTTNYTAIYDNDANSSYYPSILSLYAFYESNNDVTLTSNNTANIQFLTFDQNGDETVDDDGVMNYSQNSNWNPNANNGAGGMVNSNLFAIRINGAGSITITNSESDSVTINFQAPRTATASGGTKPKTVCGYLPIGQFARSNSMGWGTIYTDNTNVYASTKTPKFTTGYVTTGVSLGVLGGYVQFEFADAIGNDADNPYGIDFIVYGNAFNGNPEAGAVMVYGKVVGTENDYGWYNLAGSRHYTSGTRMCTDITYVKITGTAQELALNDDFSAAGIYYSRDFVKPDEDTQSDVNTAIGNASWTPIASGTGWWPEVGNSENYEQVWKMQRPDTTTVGRTGTDSDVGGVYWYQNGSAQVIRYEGVTEVIDSNTTDDYYFGYADVRPNGTNYGVAVNPYATAPSAVNGGDGFDLSWAVDADGLPVNLTDVRFVRVYSAVLFNAGIFGETSTEVNGIYVASGTNSDSIVNPTVTIGNDSFTVAGMDQIGRNVYLLEYGIGNGSNIVVSNYASATVLINGTNQYSYSSTSSNPVQIIVQNGDAEPVIIVIT